MDRKDVFDVHIRIPRPRINLSVLKPWLPSRGNIIFAIVLIVGMLGASRAGALTLAAPTSSTTTIPYQGRLVNADGTPINDAQVMTFRLYDVPVGGVALWTESWSGGTSVQVNDGLFSVLLGSLNNTLTSVVQSNSQLWLGIEVGTDEEMQPRVQLGSAAYAMQALTVPDGSIGTTKIINGNVTTAKLADGAITSSKIQDGGVATIDLADSIVTTQKIANGALTTAKIGDSVITYGKLKPSVYSVADNAPAYLSTTDTWVDLPPLSITIPASDVPVASRALVLFNARCRSNADLMAILFQPTLDGAPTSFTDVYPKQGQMLNVSMHDIVPLSANTSHVLRMRWQTTLALGEALCGDRRLTVLLLGW